MLLKSIFSQQSPTSSQSIFGISRIPMESKCKLKGFPGMALVKGSAKFCCDAIWVTSTSPLCTISLIRWYFLSICFCFLWFFGTLDWATAPLLSQNSLRGAVTAGTTSRSYRNLRSHTASFAASDAATYSASVVESAIQDCFTLLQLIAPLPNVNT